MMTKASRRRLQRSTDVDSPTSGAGAPYLVLKLREDPSMPDQVDQKHEGSLQMLFFRAATQNAFTIFLAGAAFTLMVLPKATLVPAFLAGFILVLIMQRPGMVNLPAFFTSAVARLAKLSRSCEHCDFFRPLWVAKASAMAPLVRALAFITLATILEVDGRIV